MALARCQLQIMDAAGNIIDGASVEVRDEDTLALPVVYSNRAGTVSIGNPFTASDGADAGFHVTGGVYKITATKAGFERIWRYVPVGTAQEFDFELLEVTRSGAVLAEIPGDAEVIRTIGYAVAGDGGGALYKRAASEPSHPGKFQSADGAWWELAEIEVNDKMFGAKVDGATFDDAAISDFCEYLQAQGGAVEGRFADGTRKIYTDTTAAAAELWGFEDCPVVIHGDNVIFEIGATQLTVGLASIFSFSNCDPITLPKFMRFVGNGTKEMVRDNPLRGNVCFTAFENCRNITWGTIEVDGILTGPTFFRRPQVAVDTDMEMWVTTGGTGWNVGDTFKIAKAHSGATWRGQTMTEATFEVDTVDNSDSPPVGALETFHCTNAGNYVWDSGGGTSGIAQPDFTDTGFTVAPLTGGGSGAKVLFYLKDNDPDTQIGPVRGHVHARRCTYGFQFQYCGRGVRLTADGDYLHRMGVAYGYDDFVIDYRVRHTKGAAVPMGSLQIPNRNAHFIGHRLPWTESYVGTSGSDAAGETVGLSAAAWPSRLENIEFTMKAEYGDAAWRGAALIGVSKTALNGTDLTYGRRHIFRNLRFNIAVQGIPNQVSGFGVLSNIGVIFGFDANTDWSDNNFSDWTICAQVAGGGSIVLDDRAFTGPVVIESAVSDGVIGWARVLTPASPPSSANVAVSTAAIFANKNTSYAEPLWGATFGPFGPSAAGLPFAGPDETGNVTVAPSDVGRIIAAGNNSSALDVTLFDPDLGDDGDVVYVQKTNSLAFAVVVKNAALATLTTLYRQYDLAAFVIRDVSGTLTWQELFVVNRTSSPQADYVFGIAKEALAAGDFVYMVGSGGGTEVYKADANAARPAYGFVLASASMNDLCLVHRSGANTAVNTAGLSTGDIYLSDTAGLATNTPPVSTSIVQFLGYLALSPVVAAYFQATSAQKTISFASIQNTPLGNTTRAAVNATNIDATGTVGAAGNISSTSGDILAAAGRFRSTAGVNSFHATSEAQWYRSASLPGSFPFDASGSGHFVIQARAGDNLGIVFAGGATPAVRGYMSGAGFWGFGSGWTAGSGAGSPQRLTHDLASDAVTAAVTYSKRSTHITSGTAAAGFGVGNEIELENASGTSIIAAAMEWLWTVATNAAETAELVLKTIVAGALAERARLTAVGWRELGHKRVSGSNFSKVNNTLADITGLSVAVENGKTYEFELEAYTTSNIGAGVKFAINGPTMTAIVYESFILQTGAIVAPGTSRSAAVGTTVANVTAVTVAWIRIKGTCTPSAAGNLTGQFAQNVTDAGNASLVLIGSTLKVKEIA